jgi:hypothetical protein
MRKVRLEAIAAAVALSLTSAGTSLSDVGSAAAGAEEASSGFDTAFQTGKSFTVTWGGATDGESGVASYSVTVRRAPFNGIFGPWEPFKTDVLPAPVDPVIAAAGDIACGTGHGTTAAQCQEMKTSDLLLQMNPSAVLPLGDTQYEEGVYNDYFKGTPSLPGTGYNPTWGRLKSVTRPAVGNHEYLTPGAAGYFDYFNGPGNFTGPAGDRDKGYYSFDVGTWHLVSLNSYCSGAGGCHVGSPQELWLRQDLAAHPRSCTLAYMHHPRWSSDPKGGDFANRPQVQPFFQALYDYGVELLLTGHSHFYERFAPQNPSQAPDPARGLRQIIVGTGGRSIYAPETMPTLIQPNSERRDGGSYGVLKLTLHPKSYDWEFVPIAGQTFTDPETNYPCHGIINDTTPPTAPTIGGSTPIGSAVFTGQPGATYCFQATATDFEGNTSAPSGEYCTSVPVDNVSFRHKGGWIKKRAVGHYLETFSLTQRRGATMILKNVHAKHLAIIVTKCKRCGVIDVFFQGKLLRRIRLHSSTTKKLRLIELKTFDSVQVGAVKVRVVSDGKRVRVDGLGVSPV